MKKIFYSLLFIVFAINVNFAQTPLTTAVDFTVTDTDGNVHNLFTYLNDGKYVVIDFFFTTWPSCIASSPDVNQSYIDFGCNTGDVIFISIDSGDDDAAVEQYDIDYGLDIPSVSGTQGGGDAVNSDYGISAYPTIIIIAPNHDIVNQDVWPVSTQILNDLLEGYGCVQQPCMTGLVADFSGTPTTIDAGNSVDFTDLSTGGIPTNWNWTFYGANTTSSTVQNPTNIVYNAAGTYDVRLIVSDGTVTDTLTKTDYITVNPPTVLWSDFTASTTTIIEGQTIDFYDQSMNGPPTSWTWTFSGAETTSSTDQDPVGIQYMTAGTYDVTLSVSNATENHSTTKVNYITVVDSTQLPIADFTSNFTTVMVGGTVDFYDLTTGAPTSWQWTFQGADVTSYAVQNPTGVTYNTVGVYPVTLITFNIITSDTITKLAYINVIDNSFIDQVFADFRATTARLITEGQTVSFEDLTIGYPANWEWYFEGGTPINSTVQHPIDILYTLAGSYDVRLVVNGLNIDTLTKSNYIIVTNGLWQDPNGYCDTINNLQSGDIPLTFRHLTSKWGYFPGHNGYTVKAYAEKYTNYTYSNIYGILVPVIKAYAASSNPKVRFTVWDVDPVTGEPGNELDYKDVPIGSFTPYLYHSVTFDNNPEVNGSFYVGFQLYYNTPRDTFAIYMAPNRGIGGLNTIMCLKAGEWLTPTELLNDTLNTSLGFDLIGCLVEVDEVDIESVINVYPNPSSDFVNIDFIDEIDKDVNITIYDLYGKQIDRIENVNSGTYKLDFRNQESGIYLIVFESEQQVLTKKLTIIK